MQISDKIENFYGCVYLITCNFNDKVYVGQVLTKQGLQKRWRNHKSAALRGTNKGLYAAMRKHGVENFDIQPVAYANNKTSLDNLESLYIILLDSLNREKGYNRREGGSHGQHTEETKCLLRKAHTGKVLSDEHKKNIGDAQRGKHYHSEFHKESLRIRLMGNTYAIGKTWTWPEESKLKFRKPKSETHRQKIREAAKINYLKRERNSEGRFV